MTEPTPIKRPDLARNLQLRTYPASNDVVLDLSDAAISAIDRALSGLTWLVFLPKWEAPAVVYDTGDGALAEMLELDTFVKLSNGRAVRGSKVAGVYRVNDTSLRVHVEDVKGAFTVSAESEDEIEELYAHVCAQTQVAGGPSLPAWDALVRVRTR